jgi:hypothetical protein
MIMISNPHYVNMKAAQRAYNAHDRAMQAKYGHLHSDDRLTVDEATERALISKAYDDMSGRFVAHREAYGV